MNIRTWLVAACLLALLGASALAGEGETIDRRIADQRAKLAEIERMLAAAPDQTEAKALLERLKADLAALEAQRREAKAVSGVIEETVRARRLGTNLGYDPGELPTLVVTTTPSRAIQKAQDLARQQADLKARTAELTRRNVEIVRQHAALAEREAAMKAKLGVSPDRLRALIRQKADEAASGDGPPAPAAAGLGGKAQAIEAAGRAQMARIQAEATRLRAGLAAALAERDQPRVEDLKERLARIERLRLQSGAALERIRQAKDLLHAGTPARVAQARSHLLEATAALQGARETDRAPAPPRRARRPIARVAPAAPGVAKIRHLREAATHLQAAGMGELAQRIRHAADEEEARLRGAEASQQTTRLLVALRAEVQALRTEVHELRVLVEKKAPARKKKAR